MNIVIVPKQSNNPSSISFDEHKIKLLHQFHNSLVQYGEKSIGYTFYLNKEADFEAITTLIEKMPFWEGASLSAVVHHQFINKKSILALEKYGIKGLKINLTAINLEEFKIEASNLVNCLNEKIKTTKSIHFSIVEEPAKFLFAKKNFLNELGIVSEQIIAAPLKLFEEEEVPSKNNFSAYFSTNEFQCNFYDSSITIDIEGNLLNCPSSYHLTKKVNLFECSPEDFIRYRGWLKKDLYNCAACQTCDSLSRFETAAELHENIVKVKNEGASWEGHMLWTPFGIGEFEQYDISDLSESELELKLQSFRTSLYAWKEKVATVDASMKKAKISIECPVFKSGWLIPAIESVLFQSSLEWSLYMVWDGGDALSKRILEMIAELKHPKLNIYFSENRGIARARAFLSEQANENYILPLDDDDMFHCMAVKHYAKVAANRPWFSIIRGKRRFIDETGNLMDMAAWFPFEKRNYKMGMVSDLNNHCQPYLINRAAYNQTTGWEGFPNFHYAGEDCDIYLKVEEFGSVELIDDLLYYYRLNSKRTSHILKPEGAYEMWRLLVDKSIKRIGLPIIRINEQPPFEFQKVKQKKPTQADVDFVIPYFETHEKELAYDFRRPKEGFKSEFYLLNGRCFFEQIIQEDLYPFDRIELVLSSKNAATGIVSVQIYETTSKSIVLEGQTKLDNFSHYTKNVKIAMNKVNEPTERALTIKVEFYPDRSTYHAIRVLVTDSGGQHLVMRVFKKVKDSGKELLDKCIQSLKYCDVKDDAIHIISKRQSSSKNRNDGFYMTNKPYICFLDDDVELTAKSTILDLLELMEQHDVDLIGPKLLTNEGLIFCADPYFNKLGRPVPKGLGESGEGTYEYEAIVPWLPTTMLLIKREVFLAIGGFDEGYIGSQMEDVDFCLKARRRDFKCLYAGSISAVHHNHQRNDNFSENFRQFNKRWKNYPELWIQNELLEEFL